MGKQASPDTVETINPNYALCFLRSSFEDMGLFVIDTKIDCLISRWKNQGRQFPKGGGRGGW